MILELGVRGAGVRKNDFVTATILGNKVLIFQYLFYFLPKKIEGKKKPSQPNVLFVAP